MKAPVIGILDLGRARLKATTWELGTGTKPLWTSDRLTGDFVYVGDSASLASAARGLVADLRERSDMVLAHGASLFRDGSSAAVDHLAEIVSHLCDASFLLTAEEEGLLLHTSADVRPRDVLLDIGGGSIQIVWSSSGSRVVRSWRFGTFTLQESRGLLHGSPYALYEEVLDEIRDAVSREPAPRGGRVLLASALMADFLATVGPRLGVASLDWSESDLDRGWRYCASLAPSQFPDVFPQKPKFLYGAEKALLVANAVSTALSAAARGTDASVSGGLAIEVSRRISRQALWDGLPFESLSQSRV